MAIKLKSGLLEQLKEAGYTTYRLRQEKILGEKTIQKMRDGILLSWGELNTVCNLLGGVPGDYIEYTPDRDESHSGIS